MMGLPKPLSASSLHLAAVSISAATLINAGAQWLLVAAVSHRLGLQAVGTLGLALALVTPAVGLLGLQLRALAATDAAGAISYRTYWTARLMGIFGLLIYGASVAMWHGADQVMVKTLGLIAISKACEMVSDLEQGFHQQADRSWRYTSSLLRRSLSILACLGLSILMHGDLINLLAIQTVGSFMACALDIRLTSRSGNLKSGDLRQLKSLIALALPMALVMGLTNLMASVPRITLDGVVNRQAVGAYTAILYLVLIANTAFSGYVQVAISRYAKLLLVGERAAFMNLLLKQAGIALLISVLLLAAGLGFGERALHLLYGKAQIATRSEIACACALACASMFGSITGSVATAMRIVYPQVVSVGLGCALTFACARPLTVRYGVSGAFCAAVIGTLITAIGIGLSAMRANAAKGNHAAA